MNNTSTTFALGELRCLAVADGTKNYPLKNFFANVPLAQVEEALRQRGQPVDVITTPYTYLIVDAGTHRTLVDMGAGELGPRTGRLVDNMRAAGIDPASIDNVIITHAHPDHIGGALTDEGQPTYANAQVYIHKDEWDFWHSGRATTKAPHFVGFARQQLAGLQERIHLIDRGGEISPGISVLEAPGHTPGHMVVSVSSEGKRLLYTSDVVLHPLHLEHPEWSSVYDILPEQASISKRRIYDLAAGEGVLVMGQHFAPFPSIGRVAKTHSGWRWQPVAMLP